MALIWAVCVVPMCDVCLFCPLWFVRECVQFLECVC